MGLFDKLASAGVGSRMSPELLDKVKSAGARTAALNQLANAANGHGVTAADRRQAEKALEAEVGAKRARRLREDVAIQNGAKPKGLFSW
jgi:hypothetical protein